MTDRTLDILMITCRRPQYTLLSLRRLLGSCDETMRVWVWHNGNDPDTLTVVESLLGHPRFHRFHHSPENMLVRRPTNWLFKEASGELLSVVADDCVVSDGWAHTLRQAHEDVAEFGVIACWHFHRTDFIPELANRKIRTFASGHQLMLNPWVQGSGIMLKRACVEEAGLLAEKDRGFTPYCIRLAAAGWINGWYYPLVPIDHMDDPRSANTILHTDADLVENLPLSARMRGVKTVQQWTQHLRRSARIVQEAPKDPRLYVGMRKKARRLWTRVKRQELLY